MPSLAEFQRDFAASLLDAAASSPVRASAAGLRVHRNSVIKALVDAVLANYPTVGVLMGEPWLADVARTYVLQHPPRHAVLADYGSSFPEFLQSLDLERDWPYLASVARLDRAWTQAHLAPDARALTPGRLVGIDPAVLANVRLRLHPSARFAVCASSAATIWRANRSPAAPPTELHVDGFDEAALMIRNEAGVMLLPLNDSARAFVEAIISRCSAGEAARAALRAAPESDLAGAWSALLTHGAFADIDISGD
jgi:hypothetical protein